MYPQRLDTPPPASQFRRPWSPEPFDGRVAEQRPQFSTQGLASHYYDGPTLHRDPYQVRRPREASESSVDALDLASYAMTLRRSNHQQNISSPYPPFNAIDSYLQSPPPLRTLANRDSFRSPPSLASAGASSQGHSISSHPRTPQRRPFSLPPAHNSWNSSRWNSDSLHDPYRNTSQHRDLSSPHDMPDYPEWQRPLSDVDKPPRSSPHSRHTDYDSEFGTFNHNFAPKAHPSSDGSHRNLLPWSGDESYSASSVTAEMKQDRLRMLENEFGTPPLRGDPINENVVGSVDSKGNIITAGPKKRASVRWAQGLCALAAAIASLYSALILKPVGTPPPRGKFPAYILYFLSIITVLFVLYLFVLRPCCCAGKRTKPLPHQGPGGIIALPVQSLPGGGGKKKKKRGKGGKNGDASDGVQVNLIVDPSMFGRNGHDGDEGSDGEDDNSNATARTRRRKRRSIFDGLAMEEQWLKARSFLKWLLFYDIANMLLWGAEFVLILLGSRCPAGKFNGWCDGYNVATALSFFLFIAFGFSVFFDIKDLHMSRISPRTRI